MWIKSRIKTLSWEWVWPNTQQQQHNSTTLKWIDWHLFQQFINNFDFFHLIHLVELKKVYLEMGLDHLHCVRFDFVCKYFPGLFSWAHLLPLLARFIYRPTQQQKPHVLLDTCFYYVLFTWASRKSFQTLTLLWRNRLEASRKYKYLFNLKMAIFVFFSYPFKQKLCN